jgi:hypothetical protein
VSYTIPRKDLILTDTLLKPITKLSKTFNLLPGENKEIKHKIIASSLNKRNEKRISTNNFLPLTSKQRITRTLIINTSEPKIRKKDLQRKTKINFIKLPNQIEDALEFLQNSKELKEAFGEDVITSYIKLKNMEIKDFNKNEKFDKKNSVTHWEKNSTLDC